MEVIKTILPKRKTEGTAIPTREGPNDYQYYRSYDNKWHVSVVCNYAVRSYEEGYFEIGVWCYDQKSPYWEKGVIVIGTDLTFKEVANFLEYFEDKPEQAVRDYSVDNENGK